MNANIQPNSKATKLSKYRRAREEKPIKLLL